MKKMFKVLSPIVKKDGSTFWMRVGTGFPNKDDSVNVYLDVFPKDGKLQLREFDERDTRDKWKSEGAGGVDGWRDGAAAATTAMSSSHGEPEPLPF
jgi:hypothetical protein